MIETTSLTKRYGDVVALDLVDLAVTGGSVYGLVGPNGAGKTTLLAILVGLRRPTSGGVVVAADTSSVAMLPDTPRFDAWLTGREVVRLALRLSRGGDDGDRVEEVLADAALTDAADRPVGGYSRGMLQRLGLAATVVGRPSLVLLDEPAAALDPLGRREVLDLISRLRGSATVLFSSHILADVQRVCDTVGILDEGRLRFQGPLDDLLTGGAVPRLRVRCRPPVEPLAAVLEGLPWVKSVDRTADAEVAVEVTSLDTAEAGIAVAIARSGVRVVSLGPEEVTLERAFLEVTR